MTRSPRKQLSRFIFRAPFAPSGRGRKLDAHNAQTHTQKSPQARHKYTVYERFQTVVEWSIKRTRPVISITFAILLLPIVLLISLFLRTNMAEISFAQTSVQSRIAVLRQDIESRQTKLDELEASLPIKAQKMGMIPQQGAIVIDLRDYAKKQQQKVAAAKAAQAQRERKKNHTQPHSNLKRNPVQLQQERNTNRKPLSHHQHPKNVAVQRFSQHNHTRQSAANEESRR